MDEERIAKIIANVKGGAVRYTKVSEESEFENTQVLILDTVGILSSVYGYAEWGYIGGGFGVGIHNTLEAATFGLPIAFGPKYQKFKEACDLIAIGAARSINTAEELIEWFSPLRDDIALLEMQRSAARHYTESNCGATELITADIISKIG
jgi:3-deoxy-D-manno-octulosonic-acid transferase